MPEVKDKGRLVVGGYDGSNSSAIGLILRHPYGVEGAQKLKDALEKFLSDPENRVYTVFVLGDTVGE